MRSTNGQLKPLNPEDYPIKLVKDLGRIKATEKSKQLRRHAIWECPKCFGEFSANVNGVKRGLVQNCKKCAGKKTGDRCRTHGYGHEDRLFRIWAGIITRCTNTTRKSAHSYVGKGVTTCKEWETDFLSFREWALSNNYSDNLTIDKDLLCDMNKIEPKVYSPSTCLWVTAAMNTKIRFAKNGIDRFQLLGKIRKEQQLQEEKEN